MQMEQVGWSHGKEWPECEILGRKIICILWRPSENGLAERVGMQNDLEVHGFSDEQM